MIKAEDPHHMESLYDGSFTFWSFEDATEKELTHAPEDPGYKWVRDDEMV